MPEQNLTVKIELAAPTLLGSGEGYGSYIDTDIIFDQWGLPYLPARRFKGLLRESALEVTEMFQLARLQNFRPSNVNFIFGAPGEKRQTPVLFRNFYLKEYEQLMRWIEWAEEHFPTVVTRETVLDVFTEMRQQTAIEKDGVAADNSLRTSRVLKPGITFYGEIVLITNANDKKKDKLVMSDSILVENKASSDDVMVNEKEIVQLLALGCANLRFVGGKRNRGFGEVICTLWDGDENLTVKTIAALKGAEK